MFPKGLQTAENRSGGYRVGRRCQICPNTRSKIINRTLLGSATLWEIAMHYGLPLGSLHRHQSKCLVMQTLQAVTASPSRPRRQPQTPEPYVKKILIIHNTVTGWQRLRDYAMRAGHYIRSRWGTNLIVISTPILQLYRGAGLFSARTPQCLSAATLRPISARPVLRRTNLLCWFRPVQDKIGSVTGLLDPQAAKVTAEKEKV